MAPPIQIIINQMMVFAVIMSIGIFAAKRKVLDENALMVLSRIIIKIILPCLTFSIALTTGIEVKEVSYVVLFLTANIVLIIILSCSGIISAKIFKLPDKTADIHIACSTFGNMGFVGIPLLQAIFLDGSAMTYVSFYIILDQFLIWTLGTFLVTRHIHNANYKSLIKNVMNPIVIGLIIGFIVRGFKIPIPELILETIIGIGATNKYFAFLYLGGILAFIDLRKIFTKKSLFVLVIVKMIIVPVMIYLLFFKLIGNEAVMILLIGAALPSISSPALLAKTYGSDYEYATECVLITSLASIVTIPFIVYVISFLSSFL